MKILFIILLVIVVAIAALRLRRIMRDRAAQQDTTQTYVDPQPAPLEHRAHHDGRTTTQIIVTQPPRTDIFAEETDARPEIDEAALAVTRARVSEEIPDDVLKEVLLDATPQQAAKLFAGVSHDIMTGAIGQQTQGVHFEGQAKAEDLANLSNLSSAIDDLDIWNFGDDKGKTA